MNVDSVYNGDIFDLLDTLPDNSVDMVFGDPDYNVGIKYGENNTRSHTTNFKDYMKWYVRLAQESIRVLHPEGNAFFINYPKQNSYLRVELLDDLCADVKDYSWVYNTNIGHSPKRLTTAHRSVLHCRKTLKNRFYKNNIATSYQNPTDKRVKQLIESGSLGRMPYDWFYFDLVKNVSNEKTSHPCQIPQALSEMLIKSCTQEGDVCLILFGGSGAEIRVCVNLNRHYISAEIETFYCDMIRRRLQKIEDTRNEKD